ncbi:hypothetical protein [Jiella sp. M17.18]|uniref:hypothetical protein n=1 Tax=Jiella sp. M17.18 TaxID=3234247 RepID=UPI0034DF43BB
MVEVSLGDWGVKTRLAADLSQEIGDIPLTVSVPADVASRVCPVGADDLEQQVVVSPTRTCTAKSASPALRDAVRRTISSR